MTKPKNKSNNDPNFNVLPIHSPTAAASIDDLTANMDQKKKKYEDEKEKVKRITNLKHLMSTVVIILAISAIISHSIGMVLNDHIIIYIGGFLGIGMSISVLVKQIMLARSDSLRAVHNKLRLQVNRLQGENDKLHSNVNDLKIKVEKVNTLESQLSTIVKSQGVEVDHFVELVKENGIILKKQKKFVKASFSEQLLTTVLRSDTSGDLQITDREIDILIMRLKAQRGVTVREEKLRGSLMKSQGSVSNIMHFLHDLFLEDEEEEDDEEKRKEDKLIDLDVEKMVNSQKSTFLGVTLST